MVIIVDTNPSKQRIATADEAKDQLVEPGDYFGTLDERGAHVWHYDGSRAVRVGVPDPDHRSMVTRDGSETLREALKRVPMFHTVDFVIHRMELPPGAFYPRMARPGSQHPSESPGMLPEFWKCPDLMISTLNQVRSLVGMLDSICQAVHPVSANMAAFGSSIRNLLILACTECEAQWRGVLAANGWVPEWPSTKDYVKLSPAMRLSEYAVKLQHFPWLAPVSPFASWDAGKPTKSIAWYDDYNAAKHDREAAFAQATLGSAIEAVAAVWIMVAAQFGIHGVREFPDLYRYFHLERVPLWRFSEVYTYGHDGFASDAGPRSFPW